MEIVGPSCRVFAGIVIENTIHYTSLQVWRWLGRRDGCLQGLSLSTLFTIRHCRYGDSWAVVEGICRDCH